MRHLIPLILGQLLLAPLVSADEAKLVGVEFKITVPDSAWALKFGPAKEVEGEIWMVWHLSRPADAMGAQVITTLKRRYSPIKPADWAGKKVKYFVTGKTWNWKNEEGVIFISDTEELGEKFEEGKDLGYAIVGGNISDIQKQFR